MGRDVRRHFFEREHVRLVEEIVDTEVTEHSAQRHTQYPGADEIPQASVVFPTVQHQQQVMRKHERQSRRDEGEGDPPVRSEVADDRRPQHQ